MLYKFLFPSKPDGAATSAILLNVCYIINSENYIWCVINESRYRKVV